MTISDDDNTTTDTPTSTGDDTGAQRPERKRFDLGSALEDAIGSDDPVGCLLGQFGGYLSMCWSETPSGVFESDVAADAVKRTAAAVEALVARPTLTTVPAGGRLLVVMDRDVDADPESMRALRDWIAGEVPEDMVMTAAVAQGIAQLVVIEGPASALSPGAEARVRELCGQVEANPAGWGGTEVVSFARSVVAALDGKLDG